MIKDHGYGYGSGYGDGYGYGSGDGSWYGYGYGDGDGDGYGDGDGKNIPDGLICSPESDLLSLAINVHLPCITQFGGSDAHD